MGLSHDRCIDEAVAEIRRIAGTCDGIDPTTPVPTCGDWTIADLLEHIGTINRWAATMVEQKSQERLRREDGLWPRPDDPAELAAWVGEGAAFVRDRFLVADPNTPMWAWGVPKAAGFWSRRMVHETGVHRADAELALNLDPAFDSEVAADGVDELLDNLPEAAYFAPGVRDLTGEGQVLAFEAADCGVGWRVELGPEGFTWARVVPPVRDADATVVASAGDLLLALYGRIPAQVEGSEALWEHWRTHAAI
ncbi:MAG: maleylpyruvate isomerase N-terminal domain-containing protein [Actinomycetota bacterium]|nr:maleylpyruvate isomerase family mycothiol-dependent enzyme [Acidimicrobiia bacterium]MDQ3293395.1 maleylpyruvate isomerase N-terminal domain-containing protein [Actinomycetota bacterium]